MKISGTGHFSLSAKMYGKTWFMNLEQAILRRNIGNIRHQIRYTFTTLKFTKRLKTTRFSQFFKKNPAKKNSNKKSVYLRILNLNHITC